MMGKYSCSAGQNAADMQCLVLNLQLGLALLTAGSRWSLFGLYIDLTPGCCSQSHTVVVRGQQLLLSDQDTV